VGGRPQAAVTDEGAYLLDTFLQHAGRS